MYKVKNNNNLINSLDIVIIYSQALGLLFMNIDSEITFRKLQIFLAFMDKKTLNRTATTLNISTVSVHKALHSLENALLCPLFKKEGRLLHPLPSAIIFAEHCHELIKKTQEAITATREAAGFSSERFILGSIYSLTVRVIPQLIMGLKLRRSKLNVDLRLGSNSDLLTQLRNMEIDIALISIDTIKPSAELEIFQIFSDEIYLTVPNDSPFSGRESIDLRELKEHSFVTLTEGFATYTDCNILFKAAGFSPNVTMQVNDIFTLLSMVSSGVGYALLPGRIASVYADQLKLIRISFPTPIHQNIGLVFLKSTEHNPNILSMLAECRMYAKQKKTSL